MAQNGSSVSALLKKWFYFGNDKWMRACQQNGLGHVLAPVQL